LNTALLKSGYMAGLCQPADSTVLHERDQEDQIYTLKQKILSALAWKIKTE